MAKIYPLDVVAQAKHAQNAWNNIGSSQAFGNLNTTVFATDIINAESVQNEISSLESKLTDARNRRDAAFTSLWDKLKRLRTSVKGIYGDDSSQYEMLGGTRTSERKPRSRKKASEE